MKAVDGHVSISWPLKGRSSYRKPGGSGPSHSRVWARRRNIEGGSEWGLGEEERSDRGDRDYDRHSPFRGRGTFGTGAQRQMKSPSAAERPGATAIWLSIPAPVADSTSMKEILFLVTGPRFGD